MPLEYRVNDSFMLAALFAYSKREKPGQPDDRVLLNRKLLTLGKSPVPAHRTQVRHARKFARRDAASCFN